MEKLKDIYFDGSDLSDVDADAIKKAGGLDADKYRSEEEVTRALVRDTEKDFISRMNDVMNNPDSYFDEYQLQRIHSYSAFFGMPEKEYIRRVAFKMIVSKFSPNQAIESVYREYA